MKFDELDKRMRVFETAHDHCALPGLHLVARLDGRNFTRLTKETHDFERPFDVTFRDHMVATAEHLMQCGFRVVYGFTESDEIPLLLDRGEDSFGRKLRKLNSVLAGEASARFSLLLNDHATFDCRISQLPTVENVRDYFRWRSEDAHRNALNAHCYWMLRGDGLNAGDATVRLSGLSTADKNELLFHHGVNFNDLPHWQKRGVGLVWETHDVEGTNPVTNKPVVTQRRRIRRLLDLPMRDDYSSFIAILVEGASDS